MSQADSAVLYWIAEEVIPHEAEVRAWLRRFAPSELDPSDIVQEAYSRIASAHSEGRIESGRSYFFMVARNIVRDHLKKRQVVDFVQLLDRQQADGAPSPERVCAARQELGLVWRFLNELPVRCRKIMLLRKVDGLSQREIATAMGVTENIVEKEIARGTKQLLALIAQETALPIQRRESNKAHVGGQKFERKLRR